MPVSHPIRVVLVDDHPLVRQGIYSILATASDMTVVGEADHGQAAIALTDRLSPDVALIDIHLPGMNGLDVARVIRHRSPRTKIVILSAYIDDDYLIQAVHIGAAAFALKDIPPDTLIGVIRDVACGKHPITEMVLTRPSVVTHMVRQIRDHATEADTNSRNPLTQLSTREVEILDCLARGLSNKEIAYCLCVSVQTVKNHISSLLTKLGARDRTMAVLIAIQRGWVKIGHP